MAYERVDEELDSGVGAKAVHKSSILRQIRAFWQLALHLVSWFSIRSARTHRQLRERFLVERRDAHVDLKESQVIGGG